MTESQRRSIRLSEIRERLNALNAVEVLSDEQSAEQRRLVEEYPGVETAYRAALICEDEVEVQGSQDAADGETRATLELLRECRISRFVEAADARRAVDGAEGELMSALSVPNTAGAFPLRLLDERLDEGYDPAVERDRDRETRTSLDGSDNQTGVSVRPWIDRVFIADSASQFLGVTRESVPSGDRRYVVVTGGQSSTATATIRERGEGGDRGADDD